MTPKQTAMKTASELEAQPKEETKKTGDDILGIKRDEPISVAPVDPVVSSPRQRHHVIGAPPPKPASDPSERLPLKMGMEPPAGFPNYVKNGWVPLHELDDTQVTKRVFALPIRGMGTVLHFSTRARARGDRLVIEESNLYLPGVVLKDGELVKA